MLRSFWIGMMGVLVVVLIGCNRQETPLRSSVSVSEAMAAGDTAGYRRAEAPRPFRFPQDHGPHPGYKTEWWYVTGNLETESGRHFGYQLTIFRNALAPPDSASKKRASDWATDQLYMAHFALTDVRGERFYDFERFSRGAAGLAGATARDSVRVWLEDWQISGTGSGLFPMRLRAEEGGVAVRLRLRPTKQFVRQGERGLSQKGPGHGNASYYYSFTRLRTTGTVRIDGQPFRVAGQSWLDREWSTSALSARQVGWDWFALQLDNGYDLMFYRLRRKGGGASPHSEGVLVSPDGQVTRLTADDVRLKVLERWQSEGGASYPVRWRLRVPAENVRLTVSAYLNDQELDASVRYWEGAMRVDGTFGEASVSGSGYLEMTGYGDQAGQPLS